MSELDSLKETAARIDALVEHWFFETFHGSLVARSTDVWNAVHGAKEDLRRRLSGLMGDAAQTETIQDQSPKG